MPDAHIVLAGASGIIGSRLIEALRARGHTRITVLTRKQRGDWPAGVTSVVWQPDAARQGIDAALDQLAWTLDGAHAVINLAGSSIAAGRLDAPHLQRVTGSRQDATATLIAAAKRASTPPRVWLQASAVGIYGNRGDEILSEQSALGDAQRDILVPTGLAWEAAANEAASFARLVTLRIGVVFDRDAEAWQKLLLPVRLFAGGPLGSGQQWMPWISGHDVARAIVWLLERSGSEGVYNLTAPQPARQIDVTRAIARVLRRPAWLPAPAFALRVALGKVADALLLSSQRVIPERLISEGFTFRDASIDDAIGRLLATEQAVA